MKKKRPKTSKKGQNFQRRKFKKSTSGFIKFENGQE